MPDQATVYGVFGYEHPEHDPQGLGAFLAETTDPERVKACQAWAEAEGFARVQVVKTFDGDRPDFAGVLNA